MFEKNRFLCLINDILYSDEKKFIDLINDRKRTNDVNDNSLGDLNHVFKANLFENLVIKNNFYKNQIKTKY
jgi:hypothetical protein